MLSRVSLCIFRHCRRAFSTVMGVEKNKIIINEMVLFMFVMLVGVASVLP